MSTLRESGAPAIGGYFELAPASSGGEWHPGMHRFQSARAAFRALIEARRPERVWLPYFLCAEMAESLSGLGAAICRYRLDECLRPVDVHLHSDDVLLYPNYFGVLGGQVRWVLETYSAHQVVIDHAQAFFAAPAEALATLYSPRKFFGVPDGGYLSTAVPISPPNGVDIGSLGRTRHLLRRLSGDVEGGYADYLQAEAGLCGQAPMRMSPLTQKLLQGIDYETARRRRLANYHFLHAEYGHANSFPSLLSADDVPLCYPLLCADAATRDRRLHALRSRRIYVPTYWPGVPKESEAMGLATRLLALPLDQRYGEADLDRIIAVISEAG